MPDPSGARRVALVTGGAGGIGRAIASALAAEGCDVAVLDRRLADGPVRSLTADIGDADAVATTIAGLVRDVGAPTRVVCATGVVSEALVEDLEPAEWRRVVDASLSGTFHVLRAVIPAMRAAGGGNIVAFSSGWARKGYPRGSHYAAAKAGVEALVRSVALEVAGDGIRVNAVAPGPVRTPMLDGLPDFDEAARAATIPLGHVAEPAEVVGPVLFLLGDASRYMTGQVLAVNGGMGMP